MPHHILFFHPTDHSSILLTAFGLAMEVDDRTDYLLADIYNPSHSCIYLAPEMRGLPGESVSGRVLKAADIWSVGVITYLMVTGIEPEFPENEPEYQIKFDDKTNISVNCKDFIQRALDYRPEERMSVADALKHPWLRKIRNEIMELNQKCYGYLRQFGVQSKLKKCIHLLKLCKPPNGRINTTV